MVSPKQKYLIDSSVFIQAQRVYYSLDIAPAFWKFLVKSAKDSILFSIDRVFDELNKGNDELKDWAKDSFSFAFLNTKKDQNTLARYVEIMQWANNQMQYNQPAKDEFAKANNADAWVISYALANNFSIVTQEVFDDKIKRKIPIPNVCNEFKIRFIDTFTLLRELKFKFK